MALLLQRAFSIMLTDYLCRGIFDCEFGSPHKYCGLILVDQGNVRTLNDNRAFKIKG